MAQNSDTHDEKPLGRRLGWQRLRTKRPYQSHWHNLRQDTVRLPDGEEIVYTYQEHPGYVTVVPLTTDGHVVLIRSYRYTVDDWCWELPAGGLGDGQGLTAEQVARQELAQETGGQCLEMRKIGWFYSLNGTSNARCFVFLATAVTLSGGRQLEKTEQSEVFQVPVAQALQMARDGRMTDGDSALALLRCEPHIVSTTRSTRVVTYDPAWPGLFQEEATRLTSLFAGELVAIHHMGSTAIPGMVAKPIVDILPVVRDIEAVDGFNDAMVSLGYVPKGENGIAGRRFFSRDVAGVRRYHLHVFQAGHPEIDRHLDLVAYLRAHPDQAQRYGDLKQALAEQYPNDIDHYTHGKSELIRELEQCAQTWKRLASC
jgi:GrpB-like predicted nucleotidyltransferase (UPF0157 family)/8-oxo-dGTP pyrophosphatase MutT (NUDIX family)